MLTETRENSLTSFYCYSVTTKDFIKDKIIG